MIINLYFFIALKRLRDCLMPLDINKYRHYVDHFDGSDKQKAEMIQDVWSMMQCFVDQAFGLHPVQQCLEDTENTDLQGLPESLESKDGHTLEDLRISVNTRIENRNES